MCGPLLSIILKSYLPNRVAVRTNEKMLVKHA